MKTTLLSAFVTLILATVCFHEAAAEGESPERAAVIANDRAYEAAYATANVKALADFFTENAEYTAEDGRTFSGRDAIKETIKQGIVSRKGGKIAINVDSVRVLAPEVILEKGTTAVTSKDGETSESLYTAILLKKDGKWKISQLVENPVPEVTPHDRLAELAWLVGNWEESDKSDDLTIRSAFQWARGGNYITRNVTVQRGGETTLEGWQIIGWDPAEERIHSWTFDGEGGFAEGVWTREGERWLQRETGVAPDGTRTAADNTFTKLSNDRFTWESNNRTLDGEPQPSIGRIEINRVEGD